MYALAQAYITYYHMFENLNRVNARRRVRMHEDSHCSVQWFYKCNLRFSVMILSFVQPKPVAYPRAEGCKKGYIPSWAVFMYVYHRHIK